MTRSITHPKKVKSLLNSGFESGLDGWTSSGFVEEKGRNGGSCLVHGRGFVETSQTLENVPNGWYTLRAWVRTNGIPTDANISLTDDVGESKIVSVPMAEKDWLQIVASIKLTNHHCTIGLHSRVEKGWVAFDDIKFLRGRTTLSIMGADISSLKKSEDNGGVYYNEDGVQDDAISILHDHGLNYARIRVWANSLDGYHGKEQILLIAKRLKAKGIKLLVDFHYSDTWADPGKQPKPKSWEKFDFQGLIKAVYDHTYDICNALKQQGTPPAMAQIGNEINNGMIWPDGKNDRSFVNLAVLLKKGIQAVKDCSPETEIMLHLAEAGKNDVFRWWFDEITRQGVEFDVIGASYYPYWHGTFVDLQNNLNDISERYQKPVIVVETAYPFTEESDDSTENIISSQLTDGYPSTPEGQKKMLADIMTVVRAVPQGKGLGVFWWDATWTAVPGNGWDPTDKTSGNNWENQALFDFDDRALPAMSLFKYP
jgi:arabinogalactan endo-1,4-beta-galactosidase